MRYLGVSTETAPWGIIASSVVWQHQVLSSGHWVFLLHVLVGLLLPQHADIP